MTTYLMRNRYALWLSVVLVIVGGLSALTTLPRLEDPRITNRVPLIIIPVPGASAERVEALVTEKLEDMLDEVPEIKTTESTSRAGVAIVSIELQDNVTESTNEQVFSKIRDKLADAEGLFPPEAGAPIFDDNRGAAAFTLITALVWKHESPPQLGILSRLGEDLADHLRNVPGTEIVRLYGDPQEEIVVTVDPRELADLGFTVQDIAMRSTGADAKNPAGALRTGQSDLLLEVTGELDSLARVAHVPLRSGLENELVRIGDIATVEKNWNNPPSDFALADGRRAVYVAARSEAGIRVDQWAVEARDAIDRFRRNTGNGVAVDLVFDQTTYTNQRLLALASNLLLGGLIVMVVIFITMGWRASILVGAAFPLVASLTLFGLMMVDGALHQMSIFGMIIALGLLIDNAIVVVDEIRKRLAAGFSRQEAVAAAINHLRAPLFASTLTTVLAFMPIVLLPGNVGDFVGFIGVSVILALIFSFAVSMTVIPALSGIYGRVPDPEKPAILWRDGIQSPELKSVLRRGLAWALRHPIAAMLLAVVIPAAGFAVAPSLGNQFFPPTERNMFEVKVWLPRESSIENTARFVQRIADTVREDEAINHIYWLAGGSFPTVYYNLAMDTENAPHYAHGIIVTESAQDTERLVPQLQAALDDRFPAAHIVLNQFGQGPPISADVEYRLYGPSIPRLQELGETIRTKLQEHPDILHAMMTMPRGGPKLWFNANEDDARLAGLTLDDTAGQLQGNLEGMVGGSILEDLEELPVRIRFGEDHRSDLAAVASANFVLPGGDHYAPLSAFGDITLHPEISGVTRYNGIRTNVVQGYARDESLPIDIAGDVLSALESEGFTMPPGYRIELGGDSEEESRAIQLLMRYVPILVAIMASALILSFHSVRIALLLGLVALLSAGSGVLSTWLINFPFGFNTILGTIGLIGVALNDSIVVMAAIRANPDARAGDHQAIIKEVLGCFRHVASTTLTTSGGFLPLLLFVGGDFWPSLAIVLAGGVVGATVLAVLFTPAAYVLLFRKVRQGQEAVQSPPSWKSALVGETE